MKISCSARKDWQFHVKDFLDLHRSHAKIHGGFEFGYEDIDYAFGTVEGDTKLWGGRTNEFGGQNITKLDEYWLYDHNIGVKMTLSTKTFNDDMYNESEFFLKYYHRKGNAIITSVDELAKRIKEDYPDYNIEASCIQDIDNTEKLEKKMSLGVYDTIVLPIHMNDDIEFLESIEDKEKIRMFLNVECSYNCPKKVCYGVTGKINAGEKELDKFMCSYHDLNMPRTFYNDEINWNEFYFDLSKLDKMGFNKYKLVPPWENQQRTYIMYKRNEGLGGNKQKNT